MDLARYIVAGSFIDGSGADVRRNVFLAVHNGIITAIGSATELPRNDGATIDDFSHCTIVPPLVDCSVSLARSPAVNEKGEVSSEEAEPAQKRAMVEQHIRYCHAHGVLGVAENDNIIYHGEQYQKEITQGNIIDIRTPGIDFLRINYSTSIENDSAISPRHNSPLKNGASAIVFHGTVTHEDLCRELRHKEEKKAVVVANGPRQVAEAFEAGCDAIEQGYAMGEDNLRKMADKNVLWIPSLVRAKNGLDTASTGGEVCCRFSTRYVAPGKPVPGAEAFWKKTLAGQLAQLRLARKLGVTTAVGTGAGYVGILHGESMAEEMKLFIKAGCSLVETIRCASANGAGFFGMEKLGALTVGKKATFLITRGTVQQLPRKLSYLESIYVNGAPSMTYRKNHTITNS